jgi:hypothetical protein
MDLLRCLSEDTAGRWALSIALVCCALLSGCDDDDVFDQDVVLLGQETHEACSVMWGGQDVEVRFVVSDEVVFDLHVHEGDDPEAEIATYLLGPEAVTEETSYQVSIGETSEHCISWFNPSQRALRLRYTVSYSTVP